MSQKVYIGIDLAKGTPKVAAVKHNTHLKKYYHDMVSAGMPVKKALIKVAVKIARMMYSMLKHKEYYDSSRVFLQQVYPVAA